MQAPPIYPIDRVDLPTPDRQELSNGAELYVIHADVQPVIKFEVIFEAGRWQEHRVSVAQATNVLWREGTDEITGADAAERIDFYGATLQGHNSLDHTGFTLYVLEKFLPQVLPLVFDLLLAPSFPQKEMETFIERAVAQQRINADKPDIQGYRLLTEAIFGRSHPYGYNSTEAGLRGLTRADLQRHHVLHFLGGNTMAFAAGNISAASRQLIIEQLERLPKGNTRPHDRKMAPLSETKIQHVLPHSLQSAIRMGRYFGRREHPDFAGMFVLNTILGGYFGSRLMTELREERGLTYNIYSSVDTMKYGGYIYLSAEVAKGQEEEATKAIHDELRKLQTELITDEELEMVRAYLMGSFLAMVDGPFNTAETIRTLVSENTALPHFERMVETTLTITATELRSLAQKWLSPEDFTRVVVGPEV
ncbi:MAG: M16 family metallopeptidase [Saprospiraceae bacterium]